jgi:hypothetical protein
MWEQLTPEVRHELATSRIAGLHRSADHTPLDSITARSARTIRRRAPEPREPGTVVRAKGA